VCLAKEANFTWQRQKLCQFLNRKLERACSNLERNGTPLTTNASLVSTAGGNFVSLSVPCHLKYTISTAIPKVVEKATL
jgi:hypothetical protein